MKKKIVTVALLGIVVGLVITHCLVNNNRPSLPTDLRELLERDMASNFSIVTSPVLNPSIVDKIAGYKGFRYRITEIKRITNQSDDVSHLGLCLKIYVVYRVPEKSSIYSPGSPTEEFLYIAWKVNDLWDVKMVEQSGINFNLNVDCNFTSMD